MPQIEPVRANPSRVSANFARHAGYRQPDAGNNPAPWPWAYPLLYGMCVAAALWQHGHPTITLAVLAACIPAALSTRLNLRQFPGNARYLAQALLLLLAASWGWHRYRAHADLALLLIETLSIAGLAFVPAPRFRDFRHLCLVGAFLLLYSTTCPRPAGLLLLIIALGGALLLAYRNRNSALADPLAVATRMNSPLHLPSLLGHLLVTIALTASLLPWLPAGNGHAAIIRTRRIAASISVGQWLQGALPGQTPVPSVNPIPAPLPPLPATADPTAPEPRLPGPRAPQSIDLTATPPANLPGTESSLAGAYRRRFRQYAPAGALIVADLLAVAAIAVTVRPLLRRMRSWYHRRRRLARCRRLLAAAAQFVQSHPARAITISYLLAREWLELAGLPQRRPGHNLLAYAALVGPSLPAAAKSHLDIIFNGYLLTAFGDRPPSPTIAHHLVVAAAELPRLLQL